MFIFIGLGCIKTAQDSQSASQTQVATTLSQQTIMVRQHQLYTRTES